MPQLVGLDGTDGTARDAGFFSSVSGAFKVLRSGLAATAAGDKGAITFYRRDDGKYHCEIMRHMITEDAQQFASQVDAKRWLSEWLPTIY